jgi:hypothetical protein
MAGKMLSTEPAVDPAASVRDCKLGAYTEVGARTILLEVTMADYSYVVNDAQITYTTTGKFCSIAAMTRINPGNHPMHRASQAHFTYRASSYFPGESDPDFRKLDVEGFLEKYEAAAASGRSHFNRSAAS